MSFTVVILLLMKNDSKKRRLKKSYSKAKIEELSLLNLAFESDFFKRRFLETFFINNKITTVNDKENCFYNQIYNDLK